MISATIRQNENGMYEGQIIYDDGDISACTAKTASDIHKWAYEQGADNLILK